MKFLLDGLESVRLRFRPVRKTDSEAFIPLFEHEEAISFLGLSHIDNPGDRVNAWMERVFYRYDNDLGGLNALVDKATGAIVGAAGLLIQEVENIQELEIAYSILPVKWGHGFATEAARVCKETAFQREYAKSLISIIHVENLRSQAVATKNGMSPGKKTIFKNIPVHIYRVHSSI